MAVPKRKVSKARRDKRRSSVWKLTAPTLTKCTQCGEYKLPHQVCGNFGYYKGQEIVKKAAQSASRKRRGSAPSPSSFCS